MAALTRSVGRLHMGRLPVRLPFLLILDTDRIHRAVQNGQIDYRLFDIPAALLRHGCILSLR